MLGGIITRPIAYGIAVTRLLKHVGKPTLHGQKPGNLRFPAQREIPKNPSKSTKTPPCRKDGAASKGGNEPQSKLTPGERTALTRQAKKQFEADLAREGREPRPAFSGVNN
jgi:hypothetical protein